MQQTAQGAEGKWLDLWLDVMQEEADDQMDTVEVYQMMNGICEDEALKELNL